MRGRGGGGGVGLGKHFIGRFAGVEFGRSLVTHTHLGGEENVPVYGDFISFPPLLCFVAGDRSFRPLLCARFLAFLLRLLSPRSLVSAPLLPTAAVFLFSPLPLAILFIILYY